MARASPRKETPGTGRPGTETIPLEKGLFKEKPPGGVVLSGLLSPLCCVQGLEAQRRSPANGLTGLPRSMRKAMLGHRGAESCLVCEN